MLQSGNNKRVVVTPSWSAQDQGYSEGYEFQRDCCYLWERFVQLESIAKDQAMQIQLLGSTVRNPGKSLRKVRNMLGMNSSRGSTEQRIRKRTIIMTPSLGVHNTLLELPETASRCALTLDFWWHLSLQPRHWLVFLCPLQLPRRPNFLSSLSTLP